MVIEFWDTMEDVGAAVIGVGIVEVSVEGVSVSVSVSAVGRVGVTDDDEEEEEVEVVGVAVVGLVVSFVVAILFNKFKNGFINKGCCLVLD